MVTMKSGWRATQHTDEWEEERGGHDAARKELPLATGATGQSTIVCAA